MSWLKICHIAYLADLSNVLYCSGKVVHLRECLNIARTKICMLLLP